MPELSQKERLQLSLLDRLTDDEPENKTEPRDKRVISVSKLRTLVQRDLAWLLNSIGSGAHIDLEQYPEIVSSTLNFGIMDLTGFTSSTFKPKYIERELLKCIRYYEPRIIPNTLKVKINLAPDEMNKNQITFEITGDLWAQPLPLQLFLKTEVDLETGSVELSHWN